jgi:hypothetical protein
MNLTVKHQAEELRHLANQAASRAERIIGRALKVLDVLDFRCHLPR